MLHPCTWIENRVAKAATLRFAQLVLAAMHKKKATGKAHSPSKNTLDIHKQKHSRFNYFEGSYMALYFLSTAL